MALPLSVLALAAVPAFAGAEGGGATTDGGRGGTVYEITSLADTGPGTLRACVEASGPRVCVFQTGGVIQVASRLSIQNPYITIAGQTAPGDGITLKWDGGGPDFVLAASTHDVVVRYLTCRVGLGNHTPGGNNGVSCFEIVNGDCHDIIFDHLSASWEDRGSFGSLDNYVGPNKSWSVQWSMFYEPNVGDPSGPSAGAGDMSLTDNDAGDNDFHHNLFADFGHSVPYLAVRSARVVNNIVYDWQSQASDVEGAVQADFIANAYVPGPLLQSGTSEIWATAQSFAEITGAPSIYLAGNVGPDQPDPHGDQTLLFAPSDAGWLRDAGLDPEPVPITVDPAVDLERVLLSSVGNSRGLDCDGHWFNRRDPVDARIIGEYLTRDGGLFTIEDPNHVVPSLNTGTPCAVSGSDGIPDQWKASHPGGTLGDYLDGTLPVAVIDAGVSGATITLDGSASTASHYTWLEPSGPEGFALTDGPTQTLTSSAPGDYLFTLIVQDAAGIDSLPARAAVHVTGAPLGPHAGLACACDSAGGPLALFALYFASKRCFFRRRCR